MKKKRLIDCKGCGIRRPYSGLERLSDPPFPSNRYWPNTAILFWVSPCCGKSVAHTEAAASFGERESDKVKNFADASKAAHEFNALPKARRTVDSARKIVRKHHGEFIFDRWLDQCARRVEP